MDNVKVSLTVILPGRVMVSQQEAENKPKEYYDQMSIVVEDGKSKERIHFSVRKSIPSAQHVNLTKESYDYMISAECPYWDTPRNWSSRSRKGKLEAHLHRVCSSLGGTSFTYEVIE